LSRRLQLSSAPASRYVDVGSIQLPIGAISEGPMFGVKKLKKEKPVTVCESLARFNEFNGKPIAIVGRIECGTSRIDHICFLVEDRCERPVRTDGYVWPNKLLIIDYWDEGMPKPPSTAPAIDLNALVRKLSMLRKATTRSVDPQPRFK